MEKDRYYFRVGLFVLLLIIGGIGVLGWFAGNKDKKHHITYAIYFEGSVDGLSKGSPVKLKGIEVGYVTSISFASYENDLIRVLAKIVDTAPIRSDTIATLQIQGITGTSLVSLDNEGSKEKEYLVKKKDEDYLVIQSRPSSLEKLFASMPEVLANLNQLGVQGQKLLSDENIAQFNKSLQSIDSSAQNFGNVFGGKNNKSLSQVLTELDQLLLEGKLTLREVRMLARTLREDPSIVIHGNEHEGTKLP